MLTSYKFPFDTCEPVSRNSFVAQPVSATINAVSSLILISLCVIFQPPLEVVVVLLTYAVFEA